ncbi:MAG: hypothetical protein AAGH19_03675 [Pseudomonadota bacterium]
MKFPKVKLLDLAQVLAALAVFVGLALVVYELRQTQTLARASIMASHWDQVLENNRAKLGENPADALTKICEPLTELTPQEREIISANFGIRMSMVERTRLIEEIVEMGVPWEEYAYFLLRDGLATPIGQHDFAFGVDFDSQTGKEGVVNGWPIEYQPIVDRILEEGVPECGAYWTFPEPEDSVPPPAEPQSSS